LTAFLGEKTQLTGLWKRQRGKHLPMNRILVSITAIAALTAVFGVTSSPTTAAQTPAPAQVSANAPLPGFEASIKRNQTGDGMMSMRMDPQGRTLSGMALRQLIVQSYGIQPNQLIGGPDWLTTDRWDIQLRADTAVAPPQMNLLMQQMMADRFKLVVHRETRDLPIYELRLSRPDGKPGPEMKQAAVDCGAQGTGRAGLPPQRGAGASPGPPPGPGRGQPPLGGCRMMMTPGRLETMGQPVNALTTFLSNQLGRTVIDKTGLSGGFDMVLSWTPDGFRAGGPGGQNLPALPPGAPTPPPIDPNGPPLVTALQEQLGLKVEPARGPVEVLVIDSVQQPSEN
jgi:uncharacterized protein (TIGR03435 family)